MVHSAWFFVRMFLMLMSVLIGIGVIIVDVPLLEATIISAKVAGGMVLLTFIIICAVMPIKCALGIHNFAFKTRGTPGMAIDTKTNKLVSLQPHYKRCIDCGCTRYSHTTES